MRNPHLRLRTTAAPSLRCSIAWKQSTASRGYSLGSGTVIQFLVIGHHIPTKPKAKNRTSLVFRMLCGCWNYDNVGVRLTRPDNPRHADVRRRRPNVFLVGIGRIEHEVGRDSNKL